MKHFASLFAIFISFFTANAQLGFCTGNSGDPIFTEDFGTGIGNTMLPDGTTSYLYTNGYPDDGFYTVANGTIGNPYNWHQIEDHTPNDTDGKLLIVNAGFTAGEFYRTTVSGLCETTTYEFSAWLLNLLDVPSSCSQNVEIPINVSFQIWDSTDSNLLASGDTSDIFSTPEPVWGDYGLVFQTLADQNSVILKMINNGEGGCGNDLAIDDIEFKSCGDTVIVTDASNSATATICSGDTPFLVNLTATPDFEVFSSHFYQWQESSDGDIWMDIAGENNQILEASVTTTSFYRAKVAEVAANLTNNQCILLADVFQITVNTSPNAPISGGDTDFNCNLNEAVVSVLVPSGVSVNWYDMASEGNLLLSNSLSYTATAEGTYYAEVVDDITGCVSATRTAVNASIFSPDAPVSDGDVNFDCALGEATLSVSVSQDTSVNWYDSETGGVLLLVDSTTYIANDQATYYAESIDELTGCPSNTRTAVSVSGNLESENCNIPQGISPGVSPGLNDNFDLSNFAVTQLEIYNRYGTLVYSKNDYTDEWEGQANDGEKLPVGTYFYVMIYEGGAKKRNGWVYINR